MSLIIEDYSERSIVVRGDTKPYKEELKEMGGRFNRNLRDGCGWIFSKKHEEEVRKFIENLGKKTQMEDEGGNILNLKQLTEIVFRLEKDIQNIKRTLKLKL